MPTATVSKKGWVVIPKEIREQYGIRPGDKVVFFNFGNTLTLRVRPTDEDPIKAGYGMLKGGPSMTKALLEERRWELEREERGLPPPRPQ